MRITKKEVRELLKARELYKKAKAEFDRLADSLKVKMEASGIDMVRVDGVEVSLVRGARLEPVEEVLKDRFPEIHRLSLAPDIKKIRALDKAGIANLSELIEKGGVIKKEYTQLRIK